MTDPALTNPGVEAGTLQSVFALVVSQPVLPAILSGDVVFTRCFSLECFVLTGLLESLNDVPGFEVAAQAEVSVSRVEGELELGGDGEAAVTQQVVRHVGRPLLLVTQPGRAELHLPPGQLSRQSSDTISCRSFSSSYHGPVVTPEISYLLRSDAPVHPDTGPAALPLI